MERRVGNVFGTSEMQLWRSEGKKVVLVEQRRQLSGPNSTLPGCFLGLLFLFCWRVEEVMVQLKDD